MLSAYVKQYTCNLQVYIICVQKNLQVPLKEETARIFCLSLNRNPPDSDIQVWYMLSTTLSHLFITVGSCSPSTWKTEPE